MIDNSENFINCQIGQIVRNVNTNIEEPPENVALNLTNPISCFKGRENKLKEIKAIFEENQIVVIHGTPGMGKSETASQFAVNNETHYMGNIIWIHAETEDKLKNCFTRLAKKLHFNEDADPTQMYSKFKSASCLFVFDNAENMESIQDYLPVFRLSPTVDILITSQYGKWDPPVVKVTLGPIESEDAREIFKQKLGDTKYSKYISEDLVKNLEGIPLSIQIASSIIRQDDCDVDKFISDFNDNKFIHLRFPDSEIDHYKKSVLMSISSALYRFKDTPHAIDLLCYMAYLDADNIFDTHLLSIPSIKECAEELKTGLHKLKNYSLIQLEDINGKKCSKIKIHRTIQHALRNFDLNERGGSMFKIVLKTIIPGFMINHCHSVFKYVKEEEFKEKSVEFYIDYYINNFENEFKKHIYLNKLAFYHCDKVLIEVLPKIKDRYNRTKYNKMLNKMMHKALNNRNNDLQTIDLLITYGAKLKNGYYVSNGFHKAANWLSIELFDRLLKPIVSENIINSTDFWGRTILHLLARGFNKENMKKTIECMEHLITKYEADITIKDYYENTILHSICQNKNICLETIKYLIEKCGCKQLVNTQNKDEKTPLQILITFIKRDNSDFSQIVSYFVKECEVDITIQDYRKWNTLFYLCVEETSEIIEFVLKNRDCREIINNQDLWGNFAFTKIINNYRIREEEKNQLMKLFIENEMNFNIRNYFNETLAEIADNKDLMVLFDESKKQLNGDSTSESERAENRNPPIRIPNLNPLRRFSNLVSNIFRGLTRKRRSYDVCR